MKKLNDFIDENKSCYYLTEFLIKMKEVLPTLDVLLQTKENEGLYYGTLLLYSKLFLESEANFEVEGKDVKKLINEVENVMKETSWLDMDLIRKEFSRV